MVHCCSYATLSSPARPTVSYHFLAVGIERVINNPLRCVDLMVVLEPEMSKTLGDGFESRRFTLMPQRVIGVRTVYDPGQQHQRRICIEPVAMNNSIEGTFFSVVAQFGVRNVVRSGANPIRLSQHLVGGHEEELRFRIDKLLDQPGTGDP